MSIEEFGRGAIEPRVEGDWRAIIDLRFVGVILSFSGVALSIVPYHIVIASCGIGFGSRHGGEGGGFGSG